ncbi:MAG: single-stranded DNA-binding protein [Mesotoga sp.]|uniref:single-stranded DNA-binding protein n=1 Tax=Mesotoga sp. TaxID=2053577 RepID=UPI003568D28F
MGISYNKIILVGRLTRDPETKFISSGTQVSNFNLAVDRDYPKNSNEADFIRIVTFGKTAEFVAQYMTKGRLVLVEGSLRINKWEKDGEKRSIAEVVASHIKFMETKAQTNGLSVSHNEQQNDDIAFFGSDDATESDEIPF